MAVTSSNDDEGAGALSAALAEVLKGLGDAIALRFHPLREGFGSHGRVSPTAAPSEVLPPVEAILRGNLAAPELVWSSDEDGSGPLPAEAARGPLRFAARTHWRSLANSDSDSDSDSDGDTAGPQVSRVRSLHAAQPAPEAATPQLHDFLLCLPAVADSVGSLGSQGHDDEDAVAGPAGAEDTPEPLLLFPSQPFLGLNPELEHFLSEWHTELDAKDDHGEQQATAYRIDIPTGAEVSQWRLPLREGTPAAPAAAALPSQALLGALEPRPGHVGATYACTVIRTADENVYVPNRGHARFRTLPPCGEPSLQPRMDSTPLLSLVELPDILLEMILGRLSFLDLLACACVCRRLRVLAALAEAPWQRLDFGGVSGGADDALCEKAFAHSRRHGIRFSQCSMMDCPKLSDLTLARLATGGSHLTHLLLQGCEQVRVEPTGAWRLQVAYYEETGMLRCLSGDLGRRSAALVLLPSPGGA